MKEYDIIVIGTGGGTKLVTPPSKIGYKVAVIEKESPGGTCLNRGCIPSKMLIYPAEILSLAKNSEKFQISFPGKPKVDFKSLVERISKTVDEESASILPAYGKNPNINYIQGTASFVSDKVITVNGEQLTAKRIFIASGARPSIPNIPGLAGTPYMTSREALRRTDLPKSLIVIGGGFIALELGFAYSAFGSEVTFLVRSRMLKKEDGEIVNEFERVFTKEHNVLLHANIHKLEYKKNMFHIEVEANEKKLQLQSEALLVATGIQPNTDFLNLSNTKIQTDANGYIIVNEYLETTSPEVYALGDITGRYFYRHSVNFEGEFLFRTLYQEKIRTPINYPPVPHAVFTHPQVARVGKTEEQLVQEGIDYIAAKNPYSASATGMARLSDSGFVKILVDKKSRKVLGAHAIGDEASNVIHLFILLMTIDGNLDDLLRMIYIHPALPEIARNAARKASELLQTKE
ncbi:dihydrolipoyl dehydrogenase [Leptospira mayottensis]|uniref:Dihydrolipoyl dehydrogenase n=2 Tax=Leptospira mayottensis TaxID=1137606 RepID=A0AA87SVM7_9LEPT|nr:dihydrolipoyl dehydrogenase [Leptospira mayottensis]AXR61310.1 dihydrolipoyl dehydrogenase [Leptospira mayottensis]AXR65435.1 dihydrolipoyl dehydrogenase [Leptospira mayottensis]AZQ02254.1 dihydrolipoyl dehydrogenase [Leptospira mayottensis 200901116]EKR99252.1 mercury(II) reductase family protein [Leptospira mayottensis 200901122]TGM94431.1 dihydrolipoyl dehydrogenase [Leptospira mayottensis]